MPPSTVDGLRILVIGAGPAGLCSARHILASSHGTPFPKFAAPVVLERSGAIGGTWVYGHTPLYMSLRNGPDDESYVHHSEVLTYLNQYVEHHDILKYIKFHQEVQLVEPVTTEGDSGGTKWKAKWCDLDTNECHEDIFDAVMVCNGNYSKPYIPEIPGIECFQGDILHSKDYRVPDIEAFAGKEVVILGSSFSAIDISQDIAPVAKRVTICDRSCRKILKEFPDNVCLSRNISRAEEQGFILEDGTHCPADTLIYCTGYLYDIPFLSQNCKIEVLNGDFVRPLYKHIINLEHPTMGFIGVPRLAIPFVLFDHQVQYYLKTLTGEIELPSQEDMWSECSQSTPGKGHILLHDAEWDYYKDLAKSAGLPTLPVVIKRIKNDSMCSLRREISPFKLFKYEVLDGENFKKTAIKTI